MADKLKLVLALALLGAGIAGFYILSEQALVLRVLSVLVGVAAGAAVAAQSELGQRFVVFSRESIVETKKVVWPSRKETVQTTGMVFAFVVVIAAFLWLTDKSLEWVLYDLILGWK
ncbi:MAG: preprotein translocase subunit SecE [Rhodocyclales bacterium]|nr:preprotein translocase subunit SecE [Rhodocyclales bacterium]